MSVNNMTFEQSAAFLADLYKEATGQYPAIQIANTADFTSVGTTLLQLGYDPIISAISQVLQKTIFSIRPYAQKFKDLNVTAEKWGSIVRKINFIDSDLDANDQRLTLVDGSSIDPFVVKKPKVVQTNFTALPNIRITLPSLKTSSIPRLLTLHSLVHLWPA